MSLKESYKKLGWAKGSDKLSAQVAEILIDDKSSVIDEADNFELFFKINKNVDYMRKNDITSVVFTVHTKENGEMPVGIIRKVIKSYNPNTCYFVWNDTPSKHQATPEEISKAWSEMVKDRKPVVPGLRKGEIQVSAVAREEILGAPREQEEPDGVC